MRKEKQRLNKEPPYFFNLILVGRNPLISCVTGDQKSFSRDCGRSETNFICPRMSNNLQYISVGWLGLIAALSMLVWPFLTIKYTRLWLDLALLLFSFEAIRLPTVLVLVGQFTGKSEFFFQQLGKETRPESFYIFVDTKWWYDHRVLLFYEPADYVRHS